MPPLRRCCLDNISACQPANSVLGHCLPEVSMNLPCLQVWSTSQQNSVLDIDMKANVCCVKYNPGCSHEIAVGSADHNVHLYDLRKAQAPLHVFEGEAPAAGRSANKEAAGLSRGF